MQEHTQKNTLTYNDHLQKSKLRMQEQMSKDQAQIMAVDVKMQEDSNKLATA